jgi:hypothetical protein
MDILSEVETAIEGDKHPEYQGQQKNKIVVVADAHHLTLYRLADLPDGLPFPVSSPSQNL